MEFKSAYLTKQTKTTELVSDAHFTTNYDLRLGRNCADHLLNHNIISQTTQRVCINELSKKGHNIIVFFYGVWTNRLSFSSSGKEVAVGIHYSLGD